MRRLTILLCILPVAFLLGCTDFGKVEQGRVVKFDKETKKVTLIRDVSKTSTPDYSGLPPVVYTLPTNPAETGPEPKAGLRMKLDTPKSQITIFDPQSQSFKTIAFKIIDIQENVERDHPLVFDKDAKKAKTFPVVDKAKKTITLYIGRQKQLLTFSVPEEYMALPDSAWDSGDDVRLYYKEEGKALRFMNVSKTDIFKK